jgi:hypothetical protein
MNIILDDKPISVHSKDWNSFEQFCHSCSDQIPTGRVIKGVSLDGVEVDCANPPKPNEFLNARTAVITSCLLEDLLQNVLQYQSETANNLSKEVMQLSTDCLIDLPRQTFEKWQGALDSLKSLIKFIPHFLTLQGLNDPTFEEISELELTERIQSIQESVDVARRGFESQDIVLFSDTLEMQIVPWLKEHAKYADKYLNSLKEIECRKDS